MTGPKVSLIIPTLNSEETIARCLRSCFEQTYNNIEVIVVDAYSDDNTSEIVSEAGAKLVQQDCGRTASRNIGYEVSEGHYIYHVDSDMELTKGVVTECVKYCENRGFDALIVPESNIGESFWTKCLSFEKTIARREEIGNARFIRASVYKAVEGHSDDLLSGEDADIHYRIKNHPDVKIGHTESVVKHHLGSVSLRQILRKRVMYAKDYSKKSPENVAKMNLERKSVQRQWLDNWDLFLGSPVHATGFFFVMLINVVSVQYYQLKAKILQY